MTYDTHYQKVKSKLSQLGLNLTKVTHLFRESGAVNAENEGANLYSILRMAAWCGLAVFSYYLKNTPPDVVLARGGYDVKAARDEVFNDLGRAFHAAP